MPQPTIETTREKKKASIARTNICVGLMLYNL
jgi:hypothetical protein